MSTPNRYRFEELVDDYLLSRLSVEDSEEFQELITNNPEWKTEAYALKEAFSALRTEHVQIKAPANLLSGALSKARETTGAYVLTYSAFLDDATPESPQFNNRADNDYVQLQKTKRLPKIYLMAASVAAILLISAVYFSSNPFGEDANSTSIAEGIFVNDTMIASAPDDIENDSAGRKLSAKVANAEQDQADTTPDGSLLYNPDSAQIIGRPSVVFSKGDATPKSDIVSLDQANQVASAPPKSRSQRVLELAEAAKIEAQAKENEQSTEALEASGSETVRVLASVPQAQVNTDSLDQADKNTGLPELQSAASAPQEQVVAVAKIELERETSNQNDLLRDLGSMALRSASEVSESTTVQDLAELEVIPDPAFAAEIAASEPNNANDISIVQAPEANALEMTTNSSGFLGEQELRKLPGSPSFGASARTTPAQITATAQPQPIPSSVAEFLRAQARETNGTVVENQQANPSAYAIADSNFPTANRADSTNAFRVRFSSGLEVERFLNRLKSVPVSVRYAPTSESESFTNNPSITAASTQRRQTAMLPGYRAMRGSRSPSSTVSARSTGKPIIEEFNFEGYKGFIQVDENGDFVLTLGTDVDSGKPLPEVLRDLQPVRRY